MHCRNNIKQRSYVDMDYNPKSRLLVMSAVPGGTPLADLPSVYVAYQVSQGRLQPVGRLTAHTEAIALNKLRFLCQGSDNFIAGMQSPVPSFSPL